MPSIPVDVLQEILKHVREADLATLCRVNKIFCSCSQDVLYRDIDGEDARVIQMLAQSTDLARRVRWFFPTCDCAELATALRNMSSLHSLVLSGHGIGDDVSILDGCNFKLESFSCDFPYSESFQQFLNNQQSLTGIAIWSDYEPVTLFDEMCLPNLTQVWPPPGSVYSFLGGL
jgi:hypothetical protein